MFLIFIVLFFVVPARMGVELATGTAAAPFRSAPASLLPLVAPGPPGPRCGSGVAACIMPAARGAVVRAIVRC